MPQHRNYRFNYTRPRSRSPSSTPERHRERSNRHYRYDKNDRYYRNERERSRSPYHHREQNRDYKRPQDRYPEERREHKRYEQKDPRLSLKDYSRRDREDYNSLDRRNGNYERGSKTLDKQQKQAQPKANEQERPKKQAKETSGAKRWKSQSSHSERSPSPKKEPETKKEVCRQLPPPPPPPKEQSKYRPRQEQKHAQRNANPSHNETDHRYNGHNGNNEHSKINKSEIVTPLLRLNTLPPPPPKPYFRKSQGLRPDYRRPEPPLQRYHSYHPPKAHAPVSRQNSFKEQKVVEEEPKKVHRTKFEMVMKEARNNLAPTPPATSLLILEVYKSMNKFEVETINPNWQAKLKEDVQKFHQFKEKAMKTLETSPVNDSSEAEKGRMWLWSKQLRKQEQHEIRFGLQQLRQQSLRVGQMVRRMRFLS